MNSTFRSPPRCPGSGRKSLRFLWLVLLLAVPGVIHPETPGGRHVRGIAIDSPTTLYGSQFQGGKIDIRPGEFSKSLPLVGSDFLVLHRSPPDVHGNFPDAGISIPLPDTSQILLVVTETGNALRAKAYADPPSASGDITLLNYCNLDLSYHLETGSGPLPPEECILHHVVFPPDSDSTLFSLSLTANENGQSRTMAKEAQLRLLKDTHAYLFLVQAAGPDNRKPVPGTLVFECVYDPIRPEAKTR